MKYVTIGEALDFYRKVEATPTPESKGEAIRYEGRKQIAAKIRALLKELGIKGVSVTAPNYALAQAVHIRLPRPDEPHKCEADWRSAPYVRRRDCEFCRLWFVADEGIERIILGAYPDLDNRSDSMIDWFDYKLSIG